MMLSDWKRKNNLMIISESQIKGLIAVCLTLAIIPFFIFFHSSFINYQAPIFTDQLANSLAIEVVEKDQPKGIYFVDSEAFAGKLLKDAGIGEFSFHDFKLDNGMKITVVSSSGRNHIAVTQIEADKRLALGIKFDINKATQDDLLLVKGIGEATAEKILNLRDKLGRFRNIEQLMEIKGIKEKKLAEIRKYLYVEKRNK
ncbi:MAG: helix-hairpin-helix domain-containing protein [Deltaproteobacteria bacterium]|nr:helix-hairpin-helix domain-containing protein [Deltaproteobacteria bacterium]